MSREHRSRQVSIRGRNTTQLHHSASLLRYRSASVTLSDHRDLLISLPCRIIILVCYIEGVMRGLIKQKVECILDVMLGHACQMVTDETYENIVSEHPVVWGM